MTTSTTPKETEMELSSLTPAEIDALWIEALAPSSAIFAKANAHDAEAARLAKAGPAYAARAAARRDQATALYVEARELRDAASAPFQAEWNARGGWTRAYIVPGGHVHKSTSCHTLHVTTMVSWLPEQSGLSEEQIVELAGVHACTVCYPTAPVEALKAAESAAKRATECPGSGTWEHDNCHGNRYSPRGRCNHCGQLVSITKTGKMRGHKPQAA